MSWKEQREHEKKMQRLNIITVFLLILLILEMFYFWSL